MALCTDSTNIREGNAAFGRNRVIAAGEALSLSTKEAPPHRMCRSEGSLPLEQNCSIMLIEDSTHDSFFSAAVPRVGAGRHSSQDFTAAS